MVLLTISDNPAYPSLRKGYDEEEERGTTIGKSSLQCPPRFLHTYSTSLMGVFLLFVATNIASGFSTMSATHLPWASDSSRSLAFLLFKDYPITFHCRSYLLSGDFMKLWLFQLYFVKQYMLNTYQKWIKKYLFDILEYKWYYISVLCIYFHKIQRT